MMRLIRWILGKIILFLNAVLAPKQIERSAEVQAAIEQEVSNLLLYQFEACPFCVKVRRAMHRLRLPIELRDATKKEFAEELVRGGGELQVPCLRITESDGSVRWLYESSDIIDYLEKRFAG